MVLGIKVTVFIIFALFSTVHAQQDEETDLEETISADNDEEAIDLDMFLNEQYMPLSFIMMDGSQGSNKSLNEALARQMDDGFLPIEATGSFDKALSTMSFHRKMINKYMCNNFVANEILAEIVPVEAKIQRRMLGNGVKPHRRHVPTEKMKFDEGSSGYKDWLSKTTSLEDIFRHVTAGKVSPPLNQSTKSDAPQGFHQRRDSFLSDYVDDYEEGTITGYAQFKPAMNNHQLSIPFTPHALAQIPPLPDIEPTAGSKTGYPTAPQLHDPYIGSHHISYEPVSYDKGGKALGLKDLFDIALTTLAFLSFGLFILQVLMCITLTKQQSAGMIMMPGTTGGGGNGEEIDLQGKRFKRAFEEDKAGKMFFADLNEISRRANVVIDAFLFFNTDGGKCMRKVLCENNYYVRNRQDKQKFYLPFFGMGLAWSGVKLYKNVTSSTGIELIKASVIGLGGGNCEMYYSDCKMPKQYYHTVPPPNNLPVPKFKRNKNLDDDCDIFTPDFTESQANGNVDPKSST